jgi:hypothetical protein
MFKKIIYAAIALTVVSAGYIGVKRLNYWQRSVWIFTLDSNQMIEGRGRRGFEGGVEGRRSFGGREGFQRPDFRQLPDSERVRFEAQGGRPPIGRNRNFPDSLRQRNFRNLQGQPQHGQNGAVQNFNQRPQRGEFNGGGLRGGNRSGFSRGKRVNLVNVWWFLAVFAGFTAITIYIDKAYIHIRKRATRQ